MKFVFIIRVLKLNTVRWMLLDLKGTVLSLKEKEKGILENILNM